MSAGRKVTSAGTGKPGFLSWAGAKAAARGRTIAAHANRRMVRIGISRGWERVVPIRSLLLAAAEPIDLVLAGEAERADAAGVLLGEEALEVGGGPERVAPADVDPAARQGRAGEHRTEVDLPQHLPRARVEGDELAAADGREVRHAVAHRDAGGDDVPDVAVHRLARRAA